MGTTPTARSVRAAETRRRILDAARTVLGEEGPEGFSIRHVAEAARISHAMVPYHFADKRALVHALIVQARRDWVEPLEELVDGPGTAKQRMRAIIQWMAEPETNEVMRLHQSLFVLALQDTTARKRLAAEFTRWRAPFVMLFEQLRDELGLIGMDARAVGETFAAAADGLARQQSLDPTIPTDWLLQETLERLIRGEGPKAPRARPRRRRS